MNNLLISFILILLTSVGVGFLFSRIIRIKTYPLIGEAGLWGFLIAGVLGNLLHFFIPINYIVSYAVGLVGVGYVSYLIFLNKNCRQNVTKHLLLIVFLMAFIIFSLYYSTITYDTTLYHLQTIKWIKIGALPFGLANLHDRLGFNSLWFTTASVLYFNQASPFVINGVLLFLLLCYLLQEIIILSKNKTSRYLVFLPIGLIFILFYSIYYFSISIVLNNLFTSPATDFASTIFFCYLIYSFVLSIFHNNNKFSFRFVLIAGLLVMVKLSYLPVFVFLLLYSLWNMRKSDRNSFFKDKVLFILIFSFTIWVIRSLFLSGCLVFPVAKTCFSNLSWGVPVKQVIETSTAITHWAQIPNNLDKSLYTGFNWISYWKNAVLHNRYIHQILSLLIIFGIFGIYSYLLTQNNNDNNKRISMKVQLLFLLFFLFAFVYWFIFGPDIRFIQGYFIGVVYIIAIPFLLYLGRYFQEINLNIIVQFFSMGFLLYFFIINRNNVLWILKKGNQDKWPFISKVELQYVTNKQGIKIYYPKFGDQCGSTELICATRKKEKLIILQLKDRLMFQEKE